jgi:hypothetical protein
MSIDLFSAFIIGILGSGHCIGMCGGITTMLTSALPKSTLINPQANLLSQKNSTPRYIFVLLYHVGRISSYSIIGAIVGFSGSIAAKNIGLPLAGLRVIAAVFLILLGLYLGRWYLLLNKLENLGKKMWQYISPLSKRFIPVKSPKQALFLGVLWGWLPCGLVYSTLTWSLASSSAVTGFLIMFFFGLGTLPALLSVSLGVISIKSIFNNQFFRKFVASLLVTYGVYSLIIATQLLFLYY